MNCLLFRGEEGFLFLCLCIGQDLRRRLGGFGFLVPGSATPDGVAKKSPDRQSYDDANYGAEDGEHW